MARAQSSDFMQGFRFQVAVASVDGTPRLQPDGRPEAGFNAATLPEVTVEMAEYREGTDIYTRKQPGIPSMTDVTLSRGVARLDTSFYDWIRVVIEGSGEYNSDIDIKDFHRDTALNREFPTTGGQPNLTNINVDAPAFIYHLFEAKPMRVKPGSDKDSTSSEISLAEMDISYEHWTPEAFPAP